jgi:outer membrane protein insertion porin family
MFFNKKKIFFPIMLIFLSLSILSANNIILKINVKGNKNIETSLITSVLTFGVGDELDQDKISKSIKNLYNLNIFSDISVDANPLESGIELDINLKEFPIIANIKIEGNKKLSDDKIEELITIHKESYLAPYLEKESTRKIKEEYRKKMYNLAKIYYKENKIDDTHVNLIISIKEGKKVSIKKIDILGNEQVKTKKILSIMKTKKASLFRSGKFEKDKFEADLDKIISYYNKNGFMDARIVSHQIENIDQTSLKITIVISEGKKYYFGKIIVQGNIKFPSETIISKFRFKNHEIFNQEKYQKQLTEVYSLYHEEGFIYAKFDQEFIKNGNIINIKLKITENVRAKIRKIYISGNRKTKEKIIRRQLAISPGDYFRQSKIVKSQQNIYNMGFFEPDIALDYQPINSKGDIDLSIKVNDKTSGTANGGIGYNSQDHFVGQFTISHNNLFGNAWKSALKWEFGGSTQNFTLSFTNPYIYDSNTLAGFHIYDTNKEWSSFNYKLQTVGGGITLGRSLYLVNYSKMSIGYSLYTKKYQILDNNESGISDNLTRLDSLGWQYISSINCSFSRDSRDNFFFPTNGSQLYLYSEIAGKALGGDFNYFKQIAQASWYTKLFWKFSLRNKWRFGYVTGLGNNATIPPDIRFYLGGTGPDGIRGFADRSIGPNDGGLREILYSSEIAFPIAGEQIIGLGFFDSGNSFNVLENFNFLDFKKGTGIGIRVRSPFGLIGFDYAYNLNDKKWEPHFQFGTTF